MKKNHNEYIPALKYTWLTPLYNPLMRWVMHDSTFKRRLVEQTRIEKGYRILDLGCGTATLTILLKKVYPDSEVFGLDGDEKILEIARQKVASSGLEITLDHGLAFQLPYPDNSFDRVLSSLLFHHLTTENKVCTVREIFRILKPGGELHVADLGKPHNALMYSISLIMRRLEQMPDNLDGLLPKMFQSVGFNGSEETGQFGTVFGTLSLYRARKPDDKLVCPGVEENSNLKISFS